MEHVILVDEQDNEIGTMEKMEAHQKGVLHRAFSVLIFNSKGEWLLQKRAEGKYHSAGLWTNTCCSHPRPGESVQNAAQRRLKEEMGIELLPVFSHKFIYKTAFSNDLIEHELDHVLTGKFDGSPDINPREVDNWKFINLNSIKMDLINNSNAYTTWFKILVNQELILKS